MAEQRPSQSKPARPSEPIRYIKQLKITGLWDRFDIAWELQPDVNVLAGINGSGKSTILGCMYELITVRKSSRGYLAMAKNVNLFFDNKWHIHASYSSKNGIMTSLNSLFLYDLSVDLISTFDTDLKPSEAIQKLSDDRVSTELDWQIHLLQIQYLDYQLNISRKKDVLMESGADNIPERWQTIKYPQNRFLAIIDEAFAETGKKVNRDKNHVEFLAGVKELSAYQLSSGEKQLLIILLTVLVQDNKPSILFMDEPEISLHIDWQRKLIGHIRELNPNAQIIIASHSPAIIMEGWLDKVVEISDITVPQAG
ncbi:AAA family ATPase [Methylovulum psychrotolerans]|uniref:ABC transporter ATP-binding protein n=1 Tax=Methylovulum psychrotolerans TaxID=1704499 RepID=A0A1Z4C436_9GAMM|nr:ATP-binding protein [Methylovulum psychrotolerans]ASF48293.1 ABC transporter ATP-binding protein [Methylovulum psychrotolerans]